MESSSHQLACWVVRTPPLQSTLFFLDRMRERTRYMHYSFSTEKGVPLLERNARLFLYREALAA